MNGNYPRGEPTSKGQRSLAAREKPRYDTMIDPHAWTAAPIPPPATSIRMGLSPISSLHMPTTNSTVLVRYGLLFIVIVVSRGEVVAPECTEK